MHRSALILLKWRNPENRFSAFNAGLPAMSCSMTIKSLEVLNDAIAIKSCSTEVSYCDNLPMLRNYPEFWN